MATILDRCIDAERGDAIAVNAAALGEAPVMRAFLVQIKSGKSVIMEFEAMGRDSITVAEQHQGLCGPGQYVRATAVIRNATFTQDELRSADVEGNERKAEKAHARSDRAALELQVQHLRCVGGL